MDYQAALDSQKTSDLASLAAKYGIDPSLLQPQQPATPTPSYTFDPVKKGFFDQSGNPYLDYSTGTGVAKGYDPMPGYTYDRQKQQFISDSTGQPLADASGKVYRTGQFDELGHDTKYVQDVYDQMSHFKDASLRHLALALGAGVGGGLLSMAGAAGAAGSGSGPLSSMEAFTGAPATSVLGESTFLPEAAGATAGAAGAGTSGALDALAAEAGVAPGSALTAALPEASAVADFGVGPGVASGSGPLSSLWNGIKGSVMSPSGNVDILKAIQLGATGLNTVGSMFTKPKQAQPIPLPAYMTAPLSVPSFNRTVSPLNSDADYANYGKPGSGGEHMFFSNNKVPGHRAGGPHYIKGPGSGRSDDIDAKLSNDEYVMDAETVSLLGDGSPEEGARRLDQLRANIRKHKGQQLVKGKFSSNAKPPEHYLPKKAKGGVIHPGEGSMAAIRERRAAKGMAPRSNVMDVPLQNKHRLIDVLEHRKPDYPNMSDADLAEMSRWLDTIRNTPPPTEKAKGGRIPPVGPDLKALTGGRPKSDEMRAAELAAVQRFRDAIKAQQTAQAAQALPPVAKPAPTKQQELLKFKRGGAITKLNDFAEDLEEQLNLGNTERIQQLKSQMDTLHPGLGSFYESNMLKTGTE